MGNDTEENRAIKHVCQCGKEFLRKEHLTRHQSTHTKPSFVCHICQRSFTRNDLLRRHAGRHVTTADGTKGPMTRLRACDACHANKTKCSGGLQCSLCDKRGIDCTFDRSDARGSTSAGVAEDSTPAGADSAPNPLESDPSISALPRARQLSLFLNTLTIQPEPASVDTPYPPIPTEGSFDAYVGMQVIRHGLITREPTLDRAQEKSSAFRDWALSYWGTYLDLFHENWATLVVTVFDITQAPFMLSASILIIVARLRDCDSVQMKDIVVDCHDLLVKELLRELTHEANGDRAWQYDLYRTALLNIVSALNSGIEKCVANGYILCTAFVEHLRGVGMFDSKAAERMGKTHFPGTYLPYKLGVLESRNKLVACLFKVDAYMSLQSNSLPRISHGELDVKLPQSFGLRNSWGILVWYKRLPDEPPDRASFKLSDVVSRKLEPSTLLVEDVELGLCAMIPSLWKYSQERRRGFENTSAKESLSNELALWKSDLESILHICSIQAGRSTLSSNESDFPLCAYRGDDDENPDGWKALALNRVNLMGQYATILFHLLSLHLYAEIGPLGVAADFQVSQFTGEPASAATWHWQQVSAAVKDWKSRHSPKVEGLAVMHALAIIRTVEAMSLKLDVPANCLQAVARMGLQVSLNILKA